jgi:YgiT-type zinc finger domain-containing protein
MQCPHDGTEMIHGSRTETLNYLNDSIEIEDVRGYYCPGCGEGILDKDCYDKVVEAQDKLIMRVRTSIANIRPSTESKKSCNTCYHCSHEGPSQLNGTTVDGQCRHLRIERDIYHTHEVCDFWLDEVETTARLDKSFEDSDGCEAN